MSELFSNRLRAARTERGWSQAELAQRAGLSRPEISAIETSRLVPSTATALSLAAVLGLRVEDVFTLGSAASAEWAWRPLTDPAPYWLASVGRRRLRFPAETTSIGLVPHDGLTDQSDLGVEARQTIVLAGCDPAVGLLAAELMRQRGWRLLPLLRPSRRALELLAAGLVHVAGIHLGDNAECARETVGRRVRLLRVAEWEVGVAVSRPELRTVRAVLGANLRWVNRQEGAGARRCLDALFADTPRKPRGYRREAPSHAAVADVVRSGYADAGVCVRFVAEQAGLTFRSVQHEVYDLCTTAERADDPAIEVLADVLRSAALKRLLTALPGYDTRTTGEIQHIH